MSSMHTMMHACMAVIVATAKSCEIKAAREKLSLHADKYSPL